MARKKHLINVHTSTGTTAPTGASLYLGEIAVQHTPNDPALWIKVGTAESSTQYEKFIGKTEITNILDGYVCGVTVNGTTKSPVDGIVNLENVITAETQLSSAVTGTGNVITSIAVSGHNITASKSYSAAPADQFVTLSGAAHNKITALSAGTIALVGASAASVFTSAKTYTDQEIGKLDSSTAVTAGKYITGIAISNGKISGITEENLPSAPAITASTAGTGNVFTAVSTTGHSMTFTKDMTAAAKSDLDSLSAATTTHISNNDIHVTAAQKTNWTNSGTSGANAYVGYIAHSANTTIHVTSADKTKWNAAITGVTTAGTGNAFTDYSVADNQLTLTKGATYLTTAATTTQGTRADNALQIVSGSTYIDMSAKSGSAGAKMQTATVKQQNIETSTATGQGLADAYDVKQYVGGLVTSSVDYKGATATLPTSSTVGDLYITTAQIALTAAQSATGAAQTAETGDFIIARSSGKWDVIQKNLDGAVTGSLTANTVTLGDGTHTVKSLANGSNGQVLSISNNAPTWVNATLTDTATTLDGHYTPTGNTTGGTTATTAASAVKGIVYDGKGHITSVVTGSVLTGETQLSTATTGTGNVVGSITVSNHKITTNMFSAASADQISKLSGATTAHTANTTMHITADERTRWNNAWTSGVSAYTKVEELSAGTLYELKQTNHNIPYVVTNETGTTNKLTATASTLSSLTEGQSIILHLTSGTTTASTGDFTGSCTLNITLADGTTTGQKIIYYGGTTKLTTHYAGGNDIRLTYHENLRVGTTTGLTGWWVEGNYYSDGNYNVGNVYERRYAGNRLTRYQIIGIGEDERLYPLTRVDSGDYNTGTTKPVNTIGFRPERFFYRNTTAATAANAVETAQIDYQSIYFTTARYTFNSDLATYKAIYLRGAYDESKNLFYLDTGLTTFYTQVPTNTANITLSDYFVEGDYYIYLGATYSNANYLQLDVNHELFYFDGTNLVKAWSNKILGPEYTYSGLPYINSSTTIAAAFSAITDELVKDEQVVASALNDLNDRVDELSAATGDNTELLEYIQENEEVVAGALNDLNVRVGTVETQMTGDYIPITGYQTATGTTEEELSLAETDTVNEALGKLQKQMLDNEESIAAGLNDLNSRLDNVADVVNHSTGITSLSGAVVSLSSATKSFSAATYYELQNKAPYDDVQNLSGATQALSAGTINRLNTAENALRSTLTINANGVLQGKYTPLSGNSTINLEIVQEVTGADVLLTGYELATGTTEEELAIVATDTVNEAFGKIQKQNYDNEAVIGGALNDLDERITILEVSGSSGGDIEELSGAVVNKELVIAAALNDLNARIVELSGNTGSETDPIFMASPAASITQTDIDNWNNSGGGGDVSPLSAAVISLSAGSHSKITSLSAATTAHTANTTMHITSDERTRWQSAWTSGVSAYTRVNQLSASTLNLSAVTITGVSAGGTNVTVTNKVAAIPTASTSAFGVVKIPAVGTSFINNNAGTISVATGTTNATVAVGNHTHSGYADATGLTALSAATTAHTSNGDIHVTANQKTAWTNGANSGASAYTAVTALSAATTAHTANTTVHVTSTERSTWNGKQDAISDLATIRNNALSGASAYTRVNALSGATTAHTGNTQIHVPSHSASDSGKVLSVNSSGNLEWITPVSVYYGSSTPSSSTGNDGDIYIQTS